MIDEAIEMAKELLPKQRYCMAAIITDKKGKVLSRGVNNPFKTHPLQGVWGGKIEGNGSGFLHAEVSALIRNKSEKEHTLYVARVRKSDGEVSIAKPCRVCQAIIRLETNIQRVVYTTNDGTLGEYRIKRDGC